MKVEWQRKVLGRKPGKVEDIDEKKEPRLKSWLKSGLVVKDGDPPPKIHNKPTAKPAKSKPAATTAAAEGEE